MAHPHETAKGVDARVARGCLGVRDMPVAVLHVQRPAPRKEPGDAEGILQVKFRPGADFNLVAMMESVIIKTARPDLEIRNQARARLHEVVTSHEGKTAERRAG